MQPLQRPLSSAVAGTPIVLACASCDVESILDPDRDRQRTELAAFFAVHNAHAGPQRYTVSIPFQRGRAVDNAPGAIAIAASLLSAPLLFWTASFRLTAQVRRSFPRRQRWHFT